VLEASLLTPWFDSRLYHKQPDWESNRAEHNWPSVIRVWPLLAVIVNKNLFITDLASYIKDKKINRSVDDSIAIALHTALSHLDKGNPYKRTLFIDCSSAFNTIVASKLITKVRALGLGPELPDGLTPSGEGRQQHLHHTNPLSHPDLFHLSLCSSPPPTSCLPFPLIIPCVFIPAFFIYLFPICLVKSYQHFPVFPVL
jgi:hypothetical protein